MKDVEGAPGLAPLRLSSPAIRGADFALLTGGIGVEIEASNGMAEVLNPQQDRKRVGNDLQTRKSPSQAPPYSPTPATGIPQQESLPPIWVFPRFATSALTLRF